jgi:hypothetical protein
MKLAAMRTYRVLFTFVNTVYQRKRADKVELCNICTQLAKWRRVLLEKLIDAVLIKTFLASMEPKGSLPCSQEPIADLMLN